MTSPFHLLQVNLYFQHYKSDLFCLVTAFVVTMITIPPIIHLIKKHRLYDLPNERKEHTVPVPTMGGVAIYLGLITALLLWFPFKISTSLLSLFFSITILLAMGIMDDLKDLSARYKFAIEIGLASLMAFSGIRITSFGGLLGVHDLPIIAQYSFTVLAIVGITNALNLIDGIDGLAGGISFMSLVALGLFLNLSGAQSMSIIAFALAGAILAFLYFNFNPAKIFMGDTGSLVIGFIISVLAIRLIQANVNSTQPLLQHAPSFVLGIVLIPVFDTLRVFAVRMWFGKSPFSPDKTHIHHLLTNTGFSHAFATRIICAAHAFILMEAYWLRGLNQELILAVLLATMIAITLAFKNLYLLKKSALFKRFEIN
ncbi:MAG: undecaprenyl/decaprenyl-phosphate alpha-N-acetylglucosaminyl 1-phosphate transferase [Bacteroidetes bacterium]|nr:undecaprenyl/decaprenyl-phosphate alpha-N-acetylglucosaminyl 1-phosphate transferase [Bacteroidota bacterium]